MVHCTQRNGGQTFQSLKMVHILDMWVRMQILVFFTSLGSEALGITCLDAKGASVDWYTMYKIPKISSSNRSQIREGLGALYLDDHSPQWTFMNQAMNEKQQAVYQTLSQIYKGKNDMMYIMYSDQPPSNNSILGLKGHTKGVVAFDKSSGFWLIHSLPNFPPIKSKRYDFPVNVQRYGQSLLCVSFPFNQLENVAKQLWYNEPLIYDKDVPDSFTRGNQYLQDVIRGLSPPGPTYHSALQMTSLGGQTFMSFAKSGKFGADLYDGLVAPELGQNLLVETWLSRSGDKLESNCTATYKVMKITSISLQAAGVNFHQTVDHSKWAISDYPVFKGGKVQKLDQSTKWTCIGDVNRVRSQFTRGGGTMCLQDPDVWQEYANSVASYDKCPGASLLRASADASLFWPSVITHALTLLVITNLL